MVEIEGRQLVIQPGQGPVSATGFTKGQVIDYYAHIAPYSSPICRTAADPQALSQRCGQRVFFEKNATAHRPEWVKTAPIWSEGNKRNVIILADDLSTVV